MENKIKYPRTLHFPFSPGKTSDDKVMHDYNKNFIGKYVVITEKMDGENTNLTNNSYYARSLDSNNHPSRNYVKGIWGRIQYQIPINYRICGENLYAKHSILYNNLLDYLYVYNIWDDNNRCLNWLDTTELCDHLKLTTVPVIFIGEYNENVVHQIIDNLDTITQEGIVMRNMDSFDFKDFNKNVVKWVRKNHVQSDEHWMNQPIIKINYLK